MRVVMYGADVGELRSLASLFRVKADMLDNDVRTIGVRLRGSPWSGVDAEGFRHLWSQQTSQRLRAVASRLRAAAGTLDRNATEQDHASGAEGGGGSGGGVGPGGASQWGARADFGQTVRFLGEAIISLDGPLGVFGGLGILSMLDALGELGGSSKADALLPTLGGIKEMSWIHDTISKWPAFGAATKTLGWVSLGRDGVEVIMTLTDESATIEHQVKSVLTFAGGALQQTPPTTPAFWVGTALKGAVFASEKVVEAVNEGGSFWDAVAGKKVSEDPLAATGEVLYGGAGILFNTTNETFGGFF